MQNSVRLPREEALQLAAQLFAAGAGAAEVSRRTGWSPSTVRAWRLGWERRQARGRGGDMAVRPGCGQELGPESGGRPVVLWVSQGEFRELVGALQGAASVPVVLRSDAGGEVRARVQVAEG